VESLKRKLTSGGRTDRAVEQPVPAPDPVFRAELRKLLVEVATAKARGFD